MGKRKKGFTLIELLVVLMVLTILAALILSSFKGGRTRARNAQCLSNLKSLHQAVMLYLSERSSVNKKNIPAFSVSFFKQYMGTPKEKIRCPYLPEGSLGYAINKNLLSGSNLKVLIETIPNTTILIYEAESDSSSVPASRHNGKSYAVNVLGEILLGFDSASEEYKATKIS
jgi:prepilin-type N-terminal cleavage/methylation domain-containing protein